ncbi:MAG: hypothetical protein ABL888_12015 [Pirellulaceae bacterium]
MKPSQKNPHEASRQAECRDEDQTNALLPRPKWQYAFVVIPMLVSIVLLADQVIAAFQNDQYRLMNMQPLAIFSILISGGAYFVFPIGLRHAWGLLNRITKN